MERTRSTSIDTKWFAYKRFRSMRVLRLGNRHGWRLNVVLHGPNASATSQVEPENGEDR